MTNDPYLHPVPPWLDDEVIMVENGGEMPEVVLAESLHHLGSLDPAEKDVLRAAAVRGYLKIIKRDLDPGNVGLPSFRGLQRAVKNLARMSSFLTRLGWPLPAGEPEGLASRLAAYMAAEKRALEQGRPYASATRKQVERAARSVGLDLTHFQALLEQMDALPVPDFWALRSLRRLENAKGEAKRRNEAGGKAFLEVLDGQGRVLEAAELPLVAAAECEDPECRQRVELVWRLIPLPEA